MGQTQNILLLKIVQVDTCPHCYDTGVNNPDATDCDEVQRHLLYCAYCLKGQEVRNNLTKEFGNYKIYKNYICTIHRQFRNAKKKHERINKCSQ